MGAETDALASAEEASAAEVIRYEKAYRETRRVLDEAIETLMVFEELSESAAERAQIRQARRDLQDERTDLVRANIAFHTGKMTMNPPSAELVREFSELAQQAVEMTVERTTWQAALQLSTKALDKFAQIQTL